MKFFPLINVNMPTVVGILTCMSGKNNILGLTEPTNQSAEGAGGLGCIRGNRVGESE